MRSREDGEHDSHQRNRGEDPPPPRGGGGTALPTQRECLELLGCFGAGKVRKLAEIVAATVLCGELSLGSAMVAGEWVAAHERYGRNRP